MPQDPDLLPSPKPSYRYRGPDGLDDPQTLATYSNFDVTVRLFDYANLERLLVAHIYGPSAKGQVSFHPVSLDLPRVYRREHNLSRHETLCWLRHHQAGRELRRRLGFTTVFPSEASLHYFEKQITPALQWEINAFRCESPGAARYCPLGVRDGIIDTILLRSRRPRKGADQLR